METWMDVIGNPCTARTAGAGGATVVGDGWGRDAGACATRHAHGSHWTL